MLTDKILFGLNEQIRLEGEASQEYLAMASWAETQGLEGVANFLYTHSDEERQHMLKLIRYINERGGHAIISALKTPSQSFGGVKQMFETVLEHEVMVSKKINKLVDLSLKEKDYSTHNFLQWYVSEQIEEESLARLILDKINLLGDESTGGLYHFDNDIKSLANK